jgi:hypothetical protein
MWSVASVPLNRFLLDYSRITPNDACRQSKENSRVQSELVVWLCRLRKREMLSTQVVNGLWASNHLRAQRSICGLLLKDIFGLNAQQYEFIKKDLEDATQGDSGLYQAKNATHKFALVLKLPDDIARDKNTMSAGTATLAALASGADTKTKPSSELKDETHGKSGEDVIALLKEIDQLHGQVQQLQERYESGYRHEDVYGEIGEMDGLPGEIILNGAVRPKVRIKLKDCKSVPKLVIVIKRGDLIGDVLWTHIYSNPFLMRNVSSIRIVSSDHEALPAEAVDEDILFAKSYLYIQADVKIDALYINMQHQKRVQEISHSVDLHTFTIRKLYVYTEHHLDVQWFVKRSDEVVTLLRGSIDTIPTYILAQGHTTVLYGSDFTVERFRSDVCNHTAVVDQVKFFSMPHSIEHERLISSEFPALESKIQFYLLPQRKFNQKS